MKADKRSGLYCVVAAMVDVNLKWSVTVSICVVNVYQRRYERQKGQTRSLNCCCSCYNRTEFSHGVSTTFEHRINSICREAWLVQKTAERALLQQLVALVVYIQCHRTWI